MVFVIRPGFPAKVFDEDEGLIKYVYFVDRRKCRKKLTFGKLVPECCGVEVNVMNRLSDAVLAISRWELGILDPFNSSTPQWSGDVLRGRSLMYVLGECQCCSLGLEEHHDFSSGC